MLKLFRPFLFFLVFGHSFPSRAQDEKDWLRKEVQILCAKDMAGRGYVDNGKEKAADYLEKRFLEFGLKPLGALGLFRQSYYFPVNTFPGDVALKLGNKKLLPGVDFLIDAGSASFRRKKIKVVRLDLNSIKDSAEWIKTLSSWKTKRHVYILQNADSLCKKLSIRIWRFAEDLPKGCFIIPQHGKLTWTVSTKQYPATVYYVEDTVLPASMNIASIDVQAKYIPINKISANKNENIIGVLPGQVKDSFIIFSAHYDHLGMMGKDAMFPGASDNASGTAMLLYLAHYFSTHPQHYSILFVSFSGEEAGLLGSAYFVQHPPIPLDHIRFLTNLDIMGDASDGVTVVNATEYPKQFDMLKKINTDNNCLPAIKSRGKAANSDHYHFSEAGVPSFFIYSNGGKGYYHDVFDDAASLSFNNIDKLAKLLIEFGETLNKP